MTLFQRLFSVLPKHVAPGTTYVRPVNAERRGVFVCDSNVWPNCCQKHIGKHLIKLRRDAMKKQDGENDRNNWNTVQLTGVAVRNEDPRIKSPDDILLRLSPKKPAPAAIKREESVELPNKDLIDLKHRYESEMAQWRDYERQIQEWRAQVVSIVDGIRNEKMALMKEMEALKQAHPGFKVLE